MILTALALSIAVVSPNHEITKSPPYEIIQSECPPAGYTTDRLRQMKTEGFTLPDPAARHALALALTACLGDPRPDLRDGIAFEALSKWMRGEQLDHPTLRQLREVLLSGLASQDAQGFRAPFSALTLAEFARTDRIKPWLAPDERDALVQAASRYLPAVKDYRGFSDTEGWRHGVAHGADFVLQLVLNPAVTKPQIDRLLTAIAAQVAPAANVSYHAGESDRLARPVLFIAQRKLHTEAEWTAWFADVMKPAPLASWDTAFQSERGLAKRHNTRLFLLSLFASAIESTDPGVRMLLPPLQGALKQLLP